VTGWGWGTGIQVQFLIDQGIIQNKTMGAGRVRPALLQGKNTKFRAGYMRVRGRVGREEVDIRLEQKTITNRNN
jgi:hypothetical protein